ncbi:MAG TPA: DUF885 domain-containing protein [Thermoplasmata archaeon]|nr:DUF885 domain-containing protein [Thermoplasmata archaeon]
MTDAARGFRTYLADDWAAWMKEYPEAATAYGFPGLDDRWTDDSPAGIDRRRGHLRTSLQQLRAIDRSALPGGEQLSYDLYRELLESTEAGLPFGVDPVPLRSVVPRNLWMPLNQMEGIHLLAPETLELQPKTHGAQLEAYLRRLEALPTCVDQQIALMRDGLARGYSPPKVTLHGIPAQVSGVIPDKPAESPLLTPLAKLPDSLPDSERSRIAASAQRTYTQTLVPAFRRLLRYLEDEYLPACRESIAATALPTGAASYPHLVQWQTTTSLAPAAIHEIGLAEVKRIREAMEEVARSTGFAGSIAEFNDFLRTDPRFRFGRAEELIDAYRVVAKRTDPALPRLFGRLPRLPYGVLPVPEFRAPVSPAAYYLPGAPATGRPGYFYANTFDLTARPRWEMEALSLHEAVPGHHLQLSLAQEVEGAPEFRKVAGYGAFVEGWGLYAESLGEELGLYTDPYSKFGQLTFDMWRSIRLVVDTGMHALGWSRDRAVQFFRDHTGKSDLDIGVEVDRYIVWPGQALGYKIGQLKFRELRTLAEQRLGERFDVRAFHDIALAEGALPLALLERRVHEWIARRAAEAV